MQTFTNPRNEKCSYDADRHLYWSGTETDSESVMLGEMISVSQLIAQFCSVSPWNGEKADVTFGTRVHAVAADCLNRRTTAIKPADNAERDSFSAIWQFARRIRDNNQVIGVEQTMFSNQVGVAGAIDLLFRCNNRVFLCDWKTGNLMLPAKCKFNAPFGHLVADPLTIYSLQCSMYQVLLEVGGYFTNAEFAPARMLWLHRVDGAMKVDAVTCRDLRREAAEMLLLRNYTPWYVDWQKRCSF